MLDLEKMWKCAKTEAEWFRYYGHEESRMSEDFLDVNFYDRVQSIGYTKRVIDYQRNSHKKNREYIKHNLSEYVSFLRKYTN